MAFFLLSAPLICPHIVLQPCFTAGGCLSASFGYYCCWTYNTNSTCAHGVANGLSSLALPDGRQDGNEDMQESQTPAIQAVTASGPIIKECEGRMAIRVPDTLVPFCQDLTPPLHGRGLAMLV